MVDDEFKKIIESEYGCAVVIAGSSSDKDHIEKVCSSLNDFMIPHEVRVCSAHKQLEEMAEIIGEYNKLYGSLVFIAIAGGTDALSGTLSYNSRFPVISCPPKSPNESCLNNPTGSSNAYIKRPDNVAKFIAQMYSHVNPAFRRLLAEKHLEKKENLKTADSQFRSQYV